MKPDTTPLADTGREGNRTADRIRRALGHVIRIYQVYISPVLGQHCRFYPSCSVYARTAIVRHGVMRGGLLAVKRLLRCHPLHPGGVDLVPECAPEPQGRQVT